MCCRTAVRRGACVSVCERVLARQGVEQVRTRRACRARVRERKREGEGVEEQREERDARSRGRTASRLRARARARRAPLCRLRWRGGRRAGSAVRGTRRVRVRTGAAAARRRRSILRLWIWPSWAAGDRTPLRAGVEEERRRRRRRRRGDVGRTWRQSRNQEPALHDLIHPSRALRRILGTPPPSTSIQTTAVQPRPAPPPRRRRAHSPPPAARRRVQNLH